MSEVEAQALTEAYRRAQALASGRASTGLAAAFNTLLDPSDLNGTFSRYAAVSQQIINAARADASAAAGAYYTAHREALGVVGDLAIAYAAQVPVAQALTVLIVTGPVTVRNALAAGRTLEEAMRAGLSATTGAGYRLAANGGRETLHDTMIRDGQALGYQRVSDGRPCAFCAMLCGRGPVYKSGSGLGTGRSTSRRGEKYHDRCGCHIEPVYFNDQRWAPNAKRFSDMWGDSGARTEGEFQSWYRAEQSAPGSGAEALKKYRSK